MVLRTGNHLFFLPLKVSSGLIHEREIPHVLIRTLSKFHVRHTISCIGFLHFGELKLSAVQTFQWSN
jgi:hypothetical protein